MLSVLIAPLVGLGLSALTRFDDPLPKAEELLDKMEVAIGGLEARKAPKGLLMKGTLGGAEGGGGYPFVQAWLGTNQVKWSMGKGDSATQGSTGEFCWSEDHAVGITIEDSPNRSTTEHYFAIERRAPWRSLYESAETEKREDLDGRPHYLIKMVPKSGAPETWYLDCKTLLPDGYASKLPDPQGGTFDVRLVFADWKAVDGIQFPHVKTMEVAGNPIVFRFTSIEWNAALDAAAVAPPARILEAKKDASKRATKAGEHGVCSITKIEARECLTVRQKVKVDEVSKALASMLPRVGQALAMSGAAISAPPFARFHSSDGAYYDLEAGIPVTGKAKGTETVQASTLPGGRVATTWHIGPYQELQKTVKILEDWMKAQGVKSAGGYWEIYWTDPGLEPDPAKWRTQIIWPIEG
jgi:effector-binding domain-containing protein